MNNNNLSSPSPSASGSVVPSIQARSLAPLTIRMTSDIADFSDIWPRSNALRDASCHVFQCADVLGVWNRTIGAARGATPFYVVIDNDAGEPWLGLALVIERQRGVRTLTFMDGGVSDYNAPVIFKAASPARMPTTQQIIDALTQILPSFDIIRFDKMPAQIGEHANPLVCEGSISVAPSGHVAVFDHEWKNYVSVKGRRKRRRLEDMGNLRFVVAASAEERQQMLDAMIEQKTARYLATRGWDGFERPGYRAYYPAMTQALGDSVHISALKLDDAFLAVHWGMHTEKRFYALMPSFDWSWQKMSPGNILTEDLLQWSHDSHKKWFDMGVGDEAYKDDFCNITVPLHQLVVGKTALGKLYLSASDGYRRFKATPAGKWLRTAIHNRTRNPDTSS